MGGDLRKVWFRGWREIVVRTSPTHWRSRGDRRCPRPTSRIAPRRGSAASLRHPGKTRTIQKERHSRRWLEGRVAPNRGFALEFITRGKPTVRVHFFLEADRATMPVVRPTLTRTSVRRKLLAYQATWSQGLHRTCGGFPRLPRADGHEPTRPCEEPDGGVPQSGPRPRLVSLHGRGIPSRRPRRPPGVAPRIPVAVPIVWTSSIGLPTCKSSYVLKWYDNER